MAIRSVRRGVPMVAGAAMSMTVPTVVAEATVAMTVPAMAMTTVSAVTLTMAVTQSTDRHDSQADDS